MSGHDSYRSQAGDDRPAESSNSPALARQGEEQTPSGVPVTDQDVFFRTLDAVLTRYQPPVTSTPRMNVAKELKGLGATEFKGEAEEGPVAADLWLNDVKIMLDGLHCSNVEKLDGVVSLLRGQARIWWTNVTLRMTHDQVTWSLFLEEFKHKYIGDQFIRQMKQEFLNLKQMNRTVYEYECEFNKLSRFVAELIPTEKDVCEWFVEGLHPRLKEMLIVLNLSSFQEIVNRAKALERAQNERFGDQRTQSSKRTGALSSSAPPKRGRDSGTQSQARSGGVESSVRESNQRKVRQTQSVGCGEMGHFVRDCPLGKGEPVQSERSVMIPGRGRRRGRGRSQSESSTQQEIRSTARMYNINTNEDFDDPEIIAGSRVTYVLRDIWTVYLCSSGHMDCLPMFFGTYGLFTYVLRDIWTVYLCSSGHMDCLPSRVRVGVLHIGLSSGFGCLNINSLASSRSLLGHIDPLIETSLFPGLTVLTLATAPILATSHSSILFMMALSLPSPCCTFSPSPPLLPLSLGLDDTLLLGLTPTSSVSFLATAMASESLWEFPCSPPSIALGLSPSKKVLSASHSLIAPLHMSSSLLSSSTSFLKAITLTRIWTGFLICKGNNDTGQLNVSRRPTFEFTSLSLGWNFSCVIRRRKGLVLCWGGGNTSRVADVSFESTVAGLDFICGLTTRNLTVICWGNGWNIGKACRIELPISAPLTPILAPIPSKGSKPFSQSSKGINKLSLAFFIFGSIGAFAGICTIIYGLRKGIYRFLLCMTHNFVQPTAADANIVTAVEDNNDSIAPPLRSFSIRRNSSRRLGRQRSGSSSSKQAEKTQNLSFSELSNVSNKFSIENWIGSGSFGVVYKGKLQDGRDVAIKRGESETSAHKVKKFQEKETTFESELALSARLHHKHLVGLVGFCHENDERLLVYEYMSNGSLYDHLHNKDNIEKSSSIVNSWRMRIKIALDAARGIHYLHNYAMPPIIHRDIKSSNILLDANWTARVSDFGLSLMGPESDQEFMSTSAVGTVGYIDPEYYVLNVLTPKSDIYGFGVVLSELLTGRKAVFKNEDGTGPIGVVEYATPRISAGDLWAVVDTRIGVPEVHEVEAVEVMAYTAINCVNLEGKERPNMTDIVSNLEKVLNTLRE
ncbi:putative serine/threonine-protein kinase-like protein CCR3 [Hibiscus syriacus]|uniref:Serine/threonine-protein kinase-like protein CCR3 n=1 Tax=Hibiscus syriacus TaxID=106335 RepID=A0A6A2XUT7_HIBSY|nr:putative serine/threonine-protein kinase-like protein CCR3 [Hibiscus syriacus]